VLVADDWSLGRWLTEPWGHADGVTPHRGGSSGRLAYLSQEAQEAYRAVAGWDTPDKPVDGDRLAAGLRALFPGYGLEITRDQLARTR
jgi:hypothetical protein